MSTVKTIQQQLLFGGREKVWSWGAHAWRAVNNETLQFKVKGHHFSGHVRVELDIARDTYKVHLGRFATKYQNCWKNIETIEDVYCDELTHIIDRKVEYIESYSDR